MSCWRNQVLRAGYVKQVIIFLLFVFIFSNRIQADRGVLVRAFPLGEGYYTALTVSPKGHVLVNHSESPMVTILDGYGQQNIPILGTDNTKVYEGRSGQLWTVDSQGLLLYDRNKWTQHPVAEIALELRNNPNWQLRSISIIPAELNHVLVLLPSALVEYDAWTQKLTVLKKADELNIQRFLEMQEASDGGLWMTTSDGFIKVAPPLRKITPDTDWQLYRLPTNSRIHSLQRPFEDAQTNVISVGSLEESQGHKAVVRLNNGQIEIEPLNEDRIRQVWKVWDRSEWALCYSSLLRRDPINQPSFVRQLQAGPNYDVAVETNGVFWIATPDGVSRYAPALWRPPVNASSFEGSVHAIHFDAKGSAYIAGPDGLLVYREQMGSLVRWPNDFEPAFQFYDSIYSLPDGRLALSSNDRSLIYSPSTKTMSSIVHPAQRSVKIIGQFSDGVLCVKTTKKDNPNIFHIETYDGNGFHHFLEPEPEWSWGNELWFMTQTSSGDVWLGGPGGLGVKREGERTITTQVVDTGLIGQRLTCFANVSADRLWVGTLDGIYELRGRQWELVLGGLERVNSIQKGRDGSVWVATGGGVLHFVGGVWLTHDSEEGLPSRVVYDVCLDNQGKVWVGTSRGVAVYHPEADLDPPRTLPPSIEETMTAGSGVSIRFSGKDKWDYTQSSRLFFSYRLDEGSWSPFTNIITQNIREAGAGDHMLEVRAMDRNGNKDVSFTSLAFKVVIPWFRDPRLVGVSVLGLAIICFLAGLAVNRHLRLLRSYAEVEKIVAQRTRELDKANQDLLHSHKMRALGTLAAGIAHDFNNILSIVKGSAQIISSNLGDPEKIRTRVDRIEKVVEQGAGIVRAMLGLGRVEERTFVECDLHELLVDTVRLLSDHGLPAQVVLRVLPAPSNSTIPCAREVLQQMLLNLILNGVDSLPSHGEILLSVEMNPSLPERMVLKPNTAPDYAFISVRDNGVGIAPEVVFRIFEPFYTTKDLSARRGTGLGLSMVYELAKSLGFGLTVQTAVGKGSTFMILVPCGNVSRSGVESETLQHSPNS